MDFVKELTIFRQTLQSLPLVQLCIPRKEKIKQMRLTVGQTNGPFDNIFIKKMEKEIKKIVKFSLSPSESIKPFENIVSYNNKFNNKKERLKILII